MDWLATARGLLPGRRTVRIGVTGLARAGKTALLTSLAANLLATGGGIITLPALSARLGERRLRVAVAPSGADGLPRFDYALHLAALAADPPRWPPRTSSISLLALDVEIGWPGVANNLPPRRLRLELLDYPGEWLLDIPLLSQEFAPWSVATLRRLRKRDEAREFLAFVEGLPERAPADDALADAGHELYARTLSRLRAAGLSFLQPGRFLMPAPGQPPPWLAFFPTVSRSPLATLMGERYERYRAQVRADLVAPAFGAVDRLVVLADLLSALHAGPEAFADAAASLRSVADALRWRGAGPAWLAALLPGWFGGIGRVAFAASKADHVADRQRGNLARLVGSLTGLDRGNRAVHRAFAIASVRCTEDVVWALEGRPVSAVRGRLAGAERAGRSYPGEVPDRPPDADFWTHPFLELPDFEPVRLALHGRGGVAHIGLDTLLTFLLEDVL